MTIRKRGTVYWYDFTRDGRRYQGSTRVANRQVALDIEADAKLKLAKGTHGLNPPPPETRTIGDLLDRLKQRYELRGELSSQSQSQIARVRKDFGAIVVTELTAEEIERYITKRKKQGAANATVNRVTELIRRAYKIAELRPPQMVHLSEKGNARKGFFSVQDFDALYPHLPDDMRDFCHFAFVTGWRRNEIRSLRWSDVEDDTIHLRGENAKSGEPRALPINANPELAEIIERRRQLRFVNGVLTDRIFHRDGESIGEFKKSWASACVAAGLGKMVCPKCGESSKPRQVTVCSKCKKRRKYTGRIFHDFRRSAARNLIRAGVTEKACMEILGHKTRSMFDRYNITSEKDREQAMELLAKSQKVARQKVVAIAQ